MQLSYAPQYFSTTLNTGGGITAVQTSGIIIQDSSGIDKTKPGLALFSYSSPLNTSLAEWITYTSINGSNELQGVIRGAEGFSAKSHVNGATIVFPISASHINVLNDVALFGWVPISETWTYQSSSSVTVPSDATTRFQKGDKFRLKQGGSYKYFSTLGISSNQLALTGGIEYSIANAPITDIYFSKVDSPYGFPDYFDTSSITFNTGTIDDGAGGQPMTTISKIKITGNTANHYFRATGHKANAGKYISFTPLSVLPARLYTAARIAGGQAYETSADNIGIVVLDTNIFIFFNASIPDNASLLNGITAYYSYHF